RGGVVRVGCALQTLVEGRLAPLLAAFHARYPGVRIVFREVHTRQVLERLQRGAVDLGLIHLGRVDRTVGGAHAASPSISLAQPYSEPLVLIVGPAHRLGSRSTVKLDELRDETFIGFRPGATVRKMVALATKRRGFVPTIGFTTANMGTVRAFVSAGLGISVVPKSGLEGPSPPPRTPPIDGPGLGRLGPPARNTPPSGTAAAAPAPAPLP